jgi:hypothetical protein
VSTLAAVSIQVAEPMPWYFTAAELQSVYLSDDYHQLYHLLLLCHSLLLCHHHFITASLLSQPQLIAHPTGNFHYDLVMSPKKG